jgi:nicotinate dehydrogenase subunit A
MAETKKLRVNGAEHTVAAEDDRSLLSVLREDLKLTGAHYGCGEGQCGACTILLDGKPVRSCITPVGSVGRRAVTTIEGLEKDGALHPVQQAFLDSDAMQCGYCTPGMILSAVALLQKSRTLSEAEIEHGLQGNICRCGTYRRIVRAVQRAAERTRGTARA